MPDICSGREAEAARGRDRRAVRHLALPTLIGESDVATA